MISREVRKQTMYFGILFTAENASLEREDWRESG